MKQKQFLEQIVRENEFEKDIIRCRDNGLPTCLYGFGGGAEITRRS